MDKPNPYQPSQVEPEPNSRPTPFVVRLTLVFAWTIVGCGVACGLGYMISIELGSILPALIAVIVLPATGAYVGGVRSRGQLIKIGALAALGFLICYVLRPQVSAARDVAREAEDFAGLIIFCLVPAMLLAIVGAVFAVLRSARQPRER